MLDRWCLLVPDPLVFGATGAGVFLTETAVENRKVDGRLFDPAKEIFSGAAGVVVVGFFRTLIAFDGPNACVLAEARTLPAGKPVKAPIAGTKGPANKNYEY